MSASSTILFRRCGYLFVGVASVVAALFIARPSAAFAATPTDPSTVAEVQTVVAKTAQSPYDVRFHDGLYSPSSGDVYLDGDTTVYRLLGDQLVPAPVTFSQPQTGVAPLEACGGTYTHCEHNHCQSGVFYLNYNPTTNHFSDQYAEPLVYWEQGNIRDEPYRRYGPRGVRAMHRGKRGFYSTTCFPS